MLSDESDDDAVFMQIANQISTPAPPRQPVVPRSTPPVPRSTPTSSQSSGSGLVQTTIDGRRLPSSPLWASQPTPRRRRRAEPGSEPGYEPLGSTTVYVDEPTHHQLKHENLHSYIYPANLPVRDYQRNIVSSALFKNVLCALPTGLGKTFIASTVMLNWYRWTQSAKIVFMAPTKPLVAQQIEACLGITGIPRDDTCVLMGSMGTPADRKEYWDSRRVFFVTPQTLQNDLQKGIVDPKSIVCLVVDEAHRATGRHAYSEVVAFIWRFNTSLRILALTATPSSKTEGVQEVISNLHIAKAEIRTEDSIDLSKYTHQRSIERIIVKPSMEMEDIGNLFRHAVQPRVDEMKKLGVIRSEGPSALNQFMLVKALQNYMRQAQGPIKFKASSVMSLLIKSAHALRLLDVHGIKPFYDSVSNWQAEAIKGKSKVAKSFFEEPKFLECMNYCQDVLFKRGTTSDELDPDFIGHPKLESMIDKVAEFLQEQVQEQRSDSRIMVFVEYRESAAEVVRILQNKVPGARPRLFIGQSSKRAATDKKVDGDKTKKDKDPNDATRGMSQKVQKETVQKFKDGEFNILVATSIGEEGLDIGEVDLIVCYDQSKSPIRGLQRMGRTGRKRKGAIIMLMSDAEERKLEQALDGYKFIQHQINTGGSKVGGFKYEPANRLIPKDFKPIYEERIIEIPKDNQEVLEAADIVEAITKATQKTKAKKTSNTKPKPKEKIQKRFFMPDNVETGFVSARQALTAASEPQTDGQQGKRPRILLDLDSDSDFD